MITPAVANNALIVNSNEESLPVEGNCFIPLALTFATVVVVVVAATVVVVAACATVVVGAGATVVVVVVGAGAVTVMVNASYSPYSASGYLKYPAAVQLPADAHDTE